MTASTHQGQVRLRALAAAGTGAVGAAVAGVGVDVGAASGSRAVPQPVQKRVCALTAAPQWVQNKFMAKVRAVVAWTEEPGILLKTAISSHQHMHGGIHVSFWFSQLIKQWPRHLRHLGELS